MDPLTPAQRSERMGRVKGKDTGAEMTVRRLVHGLGYRYRLHRRDLPGSPDLVFAGRRKVIFVHGCFWHRHPDPACTRARMPATRPEYWVPKLEGNRARDLRAEAALTAAGWAVLTVWECELKDAAALRARVEGFLSQ